MSGALDLQSIEKKTFRIIYQDGLLDINMGGIILCISILAFSLVTDTMSPLRIGYWMVGVGFFSAIFLVGKKYLTAPRLGQVRFGPRRQRRAKTMVLVLVCIVLLQVIFLVGSILLWRNPQWAASLGVSPSNPDFQRLLVAIVSACFVGPSMLVIAYFSDFPRGYYIALILTIAVFAFVWFWQAVYFVIAGLLIMIPGIVLLARFLHDYPLRPA